MWVLVLESKSSGWRSLREKGAEGRNSIWWMDLKKVCGGGEGGKWFDKRLTWKLGDGN